MSQFNRNLALFVLLALPLGAWLGCDRDQQAANNSAAAAAASESLPAGFVLDQAPANAKPVVAVLKDAKDGEEVVVHGKVGGRKQVFLDGRALMTIVDADVKSCKDIEGDNCPTPWDYCCEPQDQLTQKIATVQVLGTDGKPLKTDLKGVRGLAPLSEVVVKGTLHRGGPDGKAVVINASGLHVKKG